MVTPVKNQGTCGSCWAFSAAAVLEGQWFKKFNQAINISEQNFIDCVYGTGYNGCNGGWPATAFSYAYNGVKNNTAYPVIFVLILYLIQELLYLDFLFIN
jgi:C1A family cysteine protease